MLGCPVMFVEVPEIADSGDKVRDCALVQLGEAGQHCQRL